MSARSILSPLLPIAPVVVAVACAPEGDSRTNIAEKAAGPPPVVTLTATDYAYEAPETVSAGFTVFRLVNRGDEFHGATIVRLEGGRTLPEYVTRTRRRSLAAHGQPGRRFSGAHMRHHMVNRPQRSISSRVAMRGFASRPVRITLLTCSDTSRHTHSSCARAATTARSRAHPSPALPYGCLITRSSSARHPRQASTRSASRTRALSRTMS